MESDTDVCRIIQDLPDAMRGQQLPPAQDTTAVDTLRQDLNDLRTKVNKLDKATTNPDASMDTMGDTMSTLHKRADNATTREHDGQRR